MVDKDPLTQLHRTYIWFLELWAIATRIAVCLVALNNVYLRGSVCDQDLFGHSLTHTRLLVEPRCFQRRASLRVQQSRARK